MLAAAQSSGPRPAASAPDITPREPRGPGSIAAPSCADHHTFQSAALGRGMNYCVLLPADYKTAQRSYPVLYLLHGLGGDENDWTYRTRLAEHARPLPLIVVMPEGDDSWYINSVVETRNRYEDYLEDDLIAEIESKYRAVQSREGRFIAGLSMGGYGAMKAGLRHPDRYAMVGAFSSAFAVTRDRYHLGYKTPKLALGGLENPAHRDNDVYLMAAHSGSAGLPYLFLTCGTEDDFLGNTTDLIGLFNVLHIRYESHLMPGKHEWAFWDRSLRMFLEELQRRSLAVAPAAGR